VLSAFAFWRLLKISRSAERVRFSVNTFLPSSQLVIGIRTTTKVDMSVESNLYTVTEGEIGYASVVAAVNVVATLDSLDDGWG